MIVPRLRDACRDMGVKATQDAKAENDDGWVCHSQLSSAIATKSRSLPPQLRHSRDIPANPKSPQPLQTQVRHSQHK